MNKDSFENNWKRSLEEAEVNPPEKVWENISTHLDEMQIVAQLENASFEPSARVWENIELALDKKERRPFIFWWNSKIAAGIAAALLLAGSFALYNLLDDRNGTAANLNEKDDISAPSTKHSDVSSMKDENSDEGSSSKKSSAEEVINSEDQKGNIASTSRKVENGIMGTINNPKAIDKSKTRGSNKTTDTVRPESEDLAAGTLDLETPFLEKKSHKVLSFMKKLMYDPLGVSIITERKKLAFDYQPDDDSKGKEEKTLWIGLNSGLAPFDPNFKVNGFEQAALSSASSGFSRTFNSLADVSNGQKEEIFEIPLQQPYNSVKPGKAYNLGLSLEKQLTNRFSVKSGLRYLSGNSNIVSNVYSYNGRTGDLRTFWESHYISNGNNAFAENTVITKAENISNNYEFVMLPVQVAYQLPITRQLGASVSTGGSMDVMFRNVIDNISRKGSNLTPINSAYKLANFSGLAGMHLNYKIKDNWQLSLGAQMQQTITSGVDETQGFSFRPRYIGLDYSLNYRFK